MALLHGMHAIDCSQAVKALLETDTHVTTRREGAGGVRRSAVQAATEECGRLWSVPSS